MVILLKIVVITASCIAVPVNLIATTLKLNVYLLQTRLFALQLNFEHIFRIYFYFPMIIKVAILLLRLIFAFKFQIAVVFQMEGALKTTLFAERLPFAKNFKMN